MLQASDKLRLCADSHETAVITNDEYKIRELFEKDKDVQYIVDIGANLGAASFKMQTFFPNAKILVCEPEPELMKYAKLNTNNKLTYVEKAIIGDDRKEVTFNLCNWEGNGHVDGHFRWDLFTPMGSFKTGEITVKATTLKKLIGTHKFPRIDLLKIDCEGYEGEILQAFKPYMKKVKHFRGEWHGREDIKLIRDALEKTHTVFFEGEPTANFGAIYAEPKGIELPVTVDDMKDAPSGAKGFRINERTGKKQWIL